MLLLTHSFIGYASGTVHRERIATGRLTYSAETAAGGDYPCFFLDRLINSGLGNDSHSTRPKHVSKDLTLSRGSGRILGYYPTLANARQGHREGQEPGRRRFAGDSTATPEVVWSICVRGKPKRSAHLKASQIILLT